MTLEITKKIVDFSTSEYGSRVGFIDDKIIANPRGKLGKFGIACHNRITRLFHQTISATSNNDTIYINKKSTIKWLNAQVDDDYKVDINDRNDVIIDRINNISTILRPKGDNAIPVKTDRPLDSLLDKVKAFSWKCFFHITKSSWILFKLRFFLINPSEKTLKSASEMIASSQYSMARKHVAEYDKFINESEGKLSLGSGKGAVGERGRAGPAAFPYGPFPPSSERLFVQKCTKLEY